MGKKSREKRERSKDKISKDPSFLLRGLHEFQQQTAQQAARRADAEKRFQERLQATRNVLRRYRRVDAAVALSVSDLWPANVGSTVKHIFAFGQLLGIMPSGGEGAPITTYAEFSAFAHALYSAWPEFPMLEDFTPEADWGQIRVSLESEFVPMFYGSSIERTPDFVEAFRITYAGSQQAQADMDLAVAVQSHIIKAIPELASAPIPEHERAHIEVPTEAFWASCRAALLGVGQSVATWRESADSALAVGFGIFKAPDSSNAFGHSIMDGSALPYLAVVDEGQWIPFSVRNGPGVVTDRWAAKRLIGTSTQTHHLLARFIAERFRGTYMGPFTPIVGGSVHADLTISCVAPTGSLLYLVCACDHASAERVSRAAKALYTQLRRGADLRFGCDGRELVLSKSGSEGPGVNEVRIVMVLTQSSTAMGTIAVPERPARLVPMADFITILDELDELNELEEFWQYVDGERATLSPFSTGPADLFASFKDSHGVLVDGANSPTWIALDPHWGTSRRFKVLKTFWDLAPRQFPDGSSGWRLDKGTDGVIELKSRHHKAVAYSTNVGSSTVQSEFVIAPGMTVDEARMVDMFAQLLTDSLHRCAPFIADLPLFSVPQVVFTCECSELGALEDCPHEPLDKFPAVVVSAARVGERRDGRFSLKVEVRAVLAGLNEAVDGSFEIRCLLETLAACHSAAGTELPLDLAEQLKARAAEPARYQLKVSQRHVDVPDYVDPVEPTPTQYKLARKQLAVAIKELGLTPGHYELAEAKAKIDLASPLLRQHLEARLASLDMHQMLQAFIEQNDALLVAERLRIQRARQSLSHAVEYDRLESIEEARREFGTSSRHYRYLLEKVISSPSSGVGPVDDGVLRELVALVDWYMVLTGASDVLHNGVDVGGVDIDDSYIPNVFYLGAHEERESDFGREYARARLGIGINDKDAVEGEAEELLSSAEVREAFRKDVGFELQHLLASLATLSKAQERGLGSELSLSYSAPPERITQVLVEAVVGLGEEEAKRIVAFLTLSGAGVRRLPGRDVDEPDVPYWEHKKRVHRYSIRPLVTDGAELRWGAETASRTMNIWMASVRDGYLPADLDWPTVVPVVRDIKKSIEKRLELRSEEIFLRHTKWVVRGFDFFRRFRSEGFEDVGDFDVLAYWPDINLMVAVECKYNQPPHTIKDSRRLRDTIFGNAEDDRAGQVSRLLGRRLFAAKHRARMLELLKWPAAKSGDPQYIEVYVGRDVYYWMVHPPYPVPTKFVRVDALDSWISDEIQGRPTS